MHQVRTRKTNTSEPPFTCRKWLDGVKTGEVMLLQDELGGLPADWPSGTRHRGGVSLVWALVLNCGILDVQC